MRNYILLAFLPLAIFSCKQAPQQAYSDSMDPAAIRRVVNDAIVWQTQNMPQAGRHEWNPQYTGWADGVFLSAVSDWAEYDNERSLREWYQGVAEKVRWEPAWRTINPANDVAVSLAYAKIWQNAEIKERFPLSEIGEWNTDKVRELFGGWGPLIPTIERLDYQMKYCPQTDDSLRFENPLNHERWCWCDALYMAAPTYVAFANITGNQAYLDFMEKEFWLTFDVLYSPQDSLIYRDTRFIGQKEKNGAKVFWGRGNGWVLGALARVIDLLPADYPTRDRYVEMYQQMMARVASLQDENGYWHTSMLDTENYTSPETSATGFFTYALWWGINRGLMGEEYVPKAEKAWKAMVAAVHPGGKLGYVQPIGDAPENISFEKNEVYGTAAFALAGLEAARYAETID